MPGREDREEAARRIPYHEIVNYGPPMEDGAWGHLYIGSDAALGNIRDGSLDVFGVLTLGHPRDYWQRNPLEVEVHLISGVIDVDKFGKDPRAYPASVLMGELIKRHGEHIAGSLAGGEDWLIHCKDGTMSSAAFVAAMILIMNRRSGMTADQAIAKVKEARYCAEPAEAFKVFLNGMYTNLQEQMKSGNQ